MTKEMIINELLKESKNALRALHVVFGCDFEKPFGAFYIGGNFTINKVYKMASGAGFSDNDCIALLMTDDNNKLYHNTLKLVSIEHGKAVIDWERRNVYSIAAHPDYFFSKGSFEEMRKNATCHCFVICQKREYMSGYKKPVADLSGRLFMGNNAVVRCADRVGAPWYIGRVTVSDAFGRKTELSGFGRDGVKTQNINNIIDKSGYFVAAKRMELKRRANALRADRKKAAYCAIDYSEKISELKELAAARKDEIVNALISATSYSDLQNVAEMLGRWSGGLVGVVRSLEYFENRSNKKQYSSIADAEAAYNNIKAALM